jgi:hypothetical protein
MALAPCPVAVKRFFPGLLLAAAVLALSASPARAAVLYDQTAGPAPESFTSNAYPANPTVDSKLADDFTVPAGQSWEITQVDVAGTYPYGGGIYGDAGYPPSSVNLDIYTSAGVVPGSTVFSATGITATNGPDYLIPLGNVPLLGPGDYWLAVQQSEATSEAVWGWRGANAQSGDPSAVLQQGCETWPGWEVRRVCIGGDSYDQVFRLSGCVGACPDPPPSPPPAPPFLTRSSALGAVRSALADRFRNWRPGHDKRVGCARKSAVRFRCAVSWRFRDNRYTGFAIARLVDGAVRTEIHVSRD